MHDIWDDSECNPGTLPYECHDCGEMQNKVIEFRRNDRWCYVCFECLREAVAETYEHEAIKKGTEVL